MGEAVMFDLWRQALWTSVLVSAPLLSVALIAGLAIGLLQALTSVQEMTLTFVPKLAAMIGVYWLSMSFMTELLVGLFTDRLIPAIAGG